MKIFIYGDSNTCGYEPNINGYQKNAKQSFYDEDVVWWHSLTKNNTVLVNALCGRGINNKNPWLENRNAMQTVQKDICGINPDLIIVMLGTNDLKGIYKEDAKSVAYNMECLIEKLKNISKCACFLVISPPKILENNELTRKYYLGAEDKSVKLDLLYKKLCEKHGYNFVSGLNLEVGEDGEHLTKNGHQQLSQKVLQKVNENKKEKPRNAKVVK